MIPSLLVWTLLLPASDWPGFRGPDGDGHIADAQVFAQGYGLHLAWKKPLGSGYSSVSIAGGLAVTQYGDGKRDQLVAFDAESGALRWRCDMGETNIGLDGSFDGPLSTPLIDGDTVYALGPNGLLVAVKAETGTPVFQVSLTERGAPKPYYGFTASPLVDGNILIVQTGGPEAPALMGLNKHTGARVWAAPPLDTDYQTANLMTLRGKRYLVLGTGGTILGLDPQSGAERWRHDMDLQAAAHLVPAGPDRFYFSSIHYRVPSAMFQAVDAGETVALKELWRNDNLGKAMGIALYRDGFLYGFSGRFLACINADTGERAWRSRPPGPGFAVLIEDQLAVVTQEGSLHLVAADPTGYKEHASLQICDEVVYNPPSYADGKIYLRSLGTIAAVDAGGIQRTRLDDAQEGKLPQSRFAATVAEIEAAADPEAAATAFMARLARTPLIEDDRYVHLLYHGEVGDLAVNVQALHYTREFPMHRVAGTHLYTFSFPLAADAQTGYHFSRDFGTVIADPHNPDQAVQFYNDDPYSLVRMPRAHDAAHLQPAEKQGRLETVTWQSAATEAERTLEVYLPPGYPAADKKYPVLYLHYGREALQKGMLQHTLDHLAAEGKELLVVCLAPHPSLFAERGEDEGKRLARIVTDEVVPLIDARYATQATRDGRALMGYYGLGFASLYTGLHHGDLFGRVVVQTGQFTPFNQPILLEEADAAAKAGTAPEIRMVWGADDQKGNVKRMFPETNQALSEALTAKGLHVATRITPSAEGWGHWRVYQDVVLRDLFP